MPGNTSKRLFSAIKIHASDEILEVYHRLKLAFIHDRITWVDAGNLHLTLKFFGETPVADIPSIELCLQKAVQGISAFDIRIRQTGVFGSSYDPRVIWFAIESDGELQQLFLSVCEQLKSIQIFPDRQNFVPHLTIGRIKQIADKRLFQKTIGGFRDCEMGSQKIAELVLFESILQRTGPTYIALKRFPLVG